MAGIINAMLSGAGSGLAQAGQQVGEYLSRSALQEEMAAIARERDTRLEEYAKGREQRGYGHAKEMVEHTEDVRARRSIEAGKASEEAARGQVDDLSGTLRQQTPDEQTRARAGALRSRGFINEGLAVERADEERQRHVEDRTARREESQARTAQDERQHTERMEGLKKQLSLAERQLARTADPDIKIVQDDSGEFVRLNTKTGEQKKLGFKGPKDIAESEKLILGAKVKAHNDESTILRELMRDPMTNKDAIELSRSTLRKFEMDIEAFRRKSPVAESAPTTGARWEGKAGGKVMLNGIVIGTADTEEQARELIASERAKPDPLEEGDRNPVGFDQPPEEKPKARPTNPRLRRMYPTYDEKHGQGL